MAVCTKHHFQESVRQIISTRTLFYFFCSLRLAHKQCMMIKSGHSRSLHQHVLSALGSLNRDWLHSCWSPRLLVQGRWVQLGGWNCHFLWRIMPWFVDRNRWDYTWWMWPSRRLYSTSEGWMRAIERCRRKHDVLWRLEKNDFFPYRVVNVSFRNLNLSPPNGRWILCRYALNGCYRSSGAFHLPWFLAPNWSWNSVFYCWGDVLFQCYQFIMLIGSIPLKFPPYLEWFDWHCPLGVGCWPHFAGLRGDLWEWADDADARKVGVRQNPMESL